MVASNSGHRTRAENASFVIDAIRALDLEPPPQSRLMRMFRALTEATGTIHPNDPCFETALEAERDMQHLGFVFDQINPHRDSISFKALVKRMLKDSVLPQDDREQSFGRDRQFELFVAAICQSAGLSPVDYEEPDVTCTVEGTMTAIAAKRVKSLSSLEARLKDAAKQIERANLPGVIAVDTCVALNRDNRRIDTPIPDEQFALLYRRALRRFLDDYAHKISDWIEGKGVLGIVFHDHQVRLETDGEWGLSSMSISLAIPFDGSESREFTSFRTRYLGGLPNQQEL